MPKFLNGVAFVKIWAVGRLKRYVWFYFVNDEHKDVHCVRVEHKFYEYLKSKGVPTSQSMRYEIHEG